MKNRKTITAICSFIVAAMILIVGVVVSSSFISRHETDTIVLKLSEVQADGYPTALADKEFARLIQEKTGGRIIVDVYTGGKLFPDEIDALDALKAGTIDFARVSSAPVGYLVPKVNLIQLPFLYRDREHEMKVLSGKIGQFILDSIKVENIGIEGLCYYDAGARSFYFKNKVESFSEFLGKKIRIQTTPTMISLCAVYGATGVIGIPPGEVYNKLLNGIVDGAENNIPTYEDMGDYLVAPYYLKTEHMRVPEVLLASSATLERLPAADVDIIKECAKLTQEYQMQKWGEKEAESEKIVSSLVKFIELSDSELEIFKKMAEPVYADYEAEYGKLIQLIKETK